MENWELIRACQRNPSHAEIVLKTNNLSKVGSIQFVMKEGGTVEIIEEIPARSQVVVVLNRG